MSPLVMLWTAPPRARECHGCWVLLRLPRFGGASYANGYDNRSRYRKGCLSSPRHRRRGQGGHPSISGQGRPVPSRHSAPRRHHITTCPRWTSSPILQNLIFGTHRPQGVKEVSTPSRRWPLSITVAPFEPPDGPFWVLAGFRSHWPDLNLLVAYFANGEQTS